MAQKLLIHIGDYKTGSTSIQRCLSRGLFRCDSCRLFYPGKAEHHMGLARTIRKRKPEAKDHDRFLRLADEIRAAPADVAVLSAEHFQGVRPGRLRQWLETYLPGMAESTRILGYVRPHAEFTLSMYAERIKLGATTDSFDTYLPRFLETDRMNYKRRFQRWHRVFGPRLILRPMIRAQLLGQDATADFLHHALDGAPFVQTGGPILSNPSLGAEDLWFMAKVHFHLRKTRPGLPPTERRQLGHALYEGLATRAGHAEPLRYTPDQLALVRARCAADAGRMDALFFDGDPMTRALADSDRLSTSLQPATPLRITLRQTRALLRIKGLGYREVWKALLSAN